MLQKVSKGTSEHRLKELENMPHRNIRRSLALGPEVVVCTGERLVCIGTNEKASLAPSFFFFLFF